MTRLEDTLNFLRAASRVYIQNPASLISFSTTLHIISISLITSNLMDKVGDIIVQASRQRRPVRQPTFSTLTLPSEYDRLNLITRLWLQSRVIRPKEWEEKEKEREKRREEREKERERRIAKQSLESGAKGRSTAEDEKAPLVDDDKPEGSGASAADSDVTKSDEQPQDATKSRTNDGLVFRAAGHPRPKTMAEIWLWLDLCRELSPYLGKAVRFVSPLRLVIYFLAQVSDRLHTTVDLYATSQLYDLCERALGGKPASWSTALRVASSGMLMILYREVTSKLFGDNSTKLHQWLATKFERQYLSMRLEAPPHGTDDLSAALIYEAGIFSGMESGPGYHSGPYGLVNGVSGALAEAIDIAAQVTMLVQAVGGMEQIKKRDPKTLTLIGLAFAPSLITKLSDLVYSLDDDEDECEQHEEDVAEIENMEYLMRQIATSSKYKQEATLFGLHDWCLKTWDKARDMLQSRTWEASFQSQAKNVGFKLLNEMAGTAFYVLLATKTIDTGLSLGSIHTYQGTARQLVYSVKRLFNHLNQSYQSVFYAAAFAGASEPAPRGLDIDYETTRNEGGMRIVAKNLSFTYPGSDKPTLTNINLTIEPGETLAIVGYNGGGKTTLVKLLTGLFEHTSGTLTINGVAPRDFNPKTLHKRMSALFQDFNRYNLTLRENVGMGLVEKIEDRAAVNQAIDEGGAQAIRAKGGLEATLNPWGEPEPPSVAPKTWRNDDESDNESDEDDSWLQLSGGQWQRVGLSRAFMRAKSSDLVVFDEPSAALDPRAEAELFNNIHNLTNIAGTTTVYISHRFNTVRRADRIALMENGTIAEYGTHKELMEKKGQYYELFNMQAEGYLDKTETTTPVEAEAKSVEEGKAEPNEEGAVAAEASA